MRLPLDHTRLVELDIAVLDGVDGGFEFKGLYGTANVGAGFGPYSLNAGVGVSPSLFGEGAIYDSSGFGAGYARQSYGVGHGVTVGAVFGHDEASFDDVVMGGNQTVNFLVGRVSWNDNGFYVGIGPTGLNYSVGGTTRVTDQQDRHAPLDPGDGRDHANDPAPVLTDWSTAFGDHELAGDEGSSANSLGSAAPVTPKLDPVQSNVDDSSVDEDGVGLEEF